ncbi:hypothetical protein BDR06DRAFT_898641, partial [Suillus hirtellus]
VLFDDLPVKQAFYLEPTMRVARHFIEDCPGNVTVDTLGLSLANVSTIVFVIHIRALYQHPVSKLVEFSRCVPNQLYIDFNVFVHKAERLQEANNIGHFRQIHERVMDRLRRISRI